MDNTGGVPRPSVPSRRSIGLRARATLFFSLAGLLSSLALASVTFAVARNYLLEQRKSAAQGQTLVNATFVRGELRSRRDEANLVVQAVPVEGSRGFAILHIDPEDKTFTTTGLGVNQTDLPAELRANVEAGRSGMQRLDLGGEPYLVVGVTIAESGAQYYEGFPLDDVEHTLRFIGTSVAIGAAISTLTAAGI